jgi:ComF family protein
MGKSVLYKYLRDFSHLVFPFNCYGCNAALDEDELPICKDCLDHFPRTYYWRQQENSVEELFWGKIKFVRACSYLFFTKGGIVQELMHQLKYNSKQEVGHLLGKYFAQDLSPEWYSDIDVVVPGPLHKDKLKKRGYNQCDSIASSMALGMNKSFQLNAIERVRANESQTRKGRYERWINVNELFTVSQPQYLAGKHVLLVDDVVTTGSTLEACANAILSLPNTSVSLATIACPSPV